MIEREARKLAVWYPELDAESMRASEVYGQSKQQLAELRLEIKAVEQRWPIPQEMRQRMVYDAFLMTQNRHATPAAKLTAQRLLFLMAESNVRGPAQETSVTGATEMIDLQVHDQLVRLSDDLRRQMGVVEALDFRPVQDVDYGEPIDPDTIVEPSL